MVLVLKRGATKKEMEQIDKKLGKLPARKNLTLKNIVA